MSMEESFDSAGDKSEEETFNSDRVRENPLDQKEGINTSSFETLDILIEAEFVDALDKARKANIEINGLLESVTTKEEFDSVWQNLKGKVHTGLVDYMETIHRFERRYERAIADLHSELKQDDRLDKEEIEVYIKDISTLAGERIDYFATYLKQWDSLRERYIHLVNQYGDNKGRQEELSARRRYIREHHDFAAYDVNGVAESGAFDDDHPFVEWLLIEMFATSAEANDLVNSLETSD